MVNLDIPVLLMKLGTIPLNGTPSLGQAISHVMQKIPDERSHFDIITESGLISFPRMGEIFRSDDYTIWARENL